MTATNIESKPVKYLMENNIVLDIVCENDTILSQMSLLYNKLDVEDPRDIFVVVLEYKTKKLKGIITLSEYKKINDALKTNNEITFSNEYYITPKTILYTDSINKVLNMFESRDVNIVLVVDDKNHYMGKIKRTNIKKRLNDFLKDF